MEDVMVQKIKNYFNKEYSKTLPENRKEKKSSVSGAVGRLLIIFFLAMLLFTFVSRAAASFTVARVTVENPERDKLIYSVTGVGEIIPKDEESFFVSPGYRIETVYVSAGEKVSKDTVMFRFDLEDLHRNYDLNAIEIEKTKLLIAQEKLRRPTQDNTSSQLNLLLLQQAKSNLKTAKSNLEQAQKEYETSLNASKEELLKNKKKEYEEAVKNHNKALRNYNITLNSQEKQLKQSQRIIDDARTSLSRVNEEKTHIIQLIDDYISSIKEKDKGASYRAQKEIYEAFYGGEDAYEEHKNTVYKAALAVSGDRYYIGNLQNRILYYDEQINIAYKNIQRARKASDTLARNEESMEQLEKRYNDVLTNYLNNVSEYTYQIDLCEAAMTNESDELIRLRRDDKSLDGFLLELQRSIDSGENYDDQSNDLCDFILGDRKKTLEKDNADMVLALKRAEEDYESLKNEIEMTRTGLNDETRELEGITLNIKDDITSMENGTYNYEEALEGKKQAIKSAKEAVRVATQAVETTTMQYELSRDNKDYKSSSQITDLILEGYYIDLKEKENIQNEIDQLLECSGEVVSPCEGVITQIGLEAGRSTTREDIIKIGTGNYEFKAAFNREETINLELGGNVDVTLAGKKKSIESEIGKISINKDGLTEVISSLPEGEYYFGEKADFRITTESEQFDQCITIQALHEDTKGYYVLVMREQEGILGMQEVAERINISLLGKSASAVAVEGVSSKSKVITDSNKYVSSGDKVRTE
jgi:multidrug efflux pump subunit AcrA (membrane-fusion protein)